MFRNPCRLRSGLVLAAVLLASSFAAPVVAAEESPAAERAAVTQVVTDAYVDGVHNFRDPAAMRRGFHPDFEMLSLRDGKLARLTLDKWIEGMEARNLKEPPPKAAPDAPRETTAKFVAVEIAGTAATCKVEIWRGGKQLFTDFLALYRFADGWKIVSKTFYRHP
jgi:hypothetical protein